MPTIQHTARRLSVHKLFGSCIRRCLVSRACDWVMSALSAVLLIYSFQSRPAFFHVGQPGGTAAYMIYPISDVAENLGRFLVRSVHPREWFWIDSNGKNGHPVKESFGSEFPTISNHCVVKSLDIEILLETFAFFFVKMTPYGKIFKILYRKFSSRHRSTLLCSNFMKFGRREIGEILRYLPHVKNNISPSSQTVTNARITPKICQQFTHSAPDFIQIRSLSVELWPNARTPLNVPLKGIQYSAEAYLRAE